MKLIIYLICIFIAMIKTADATPIDSQKAIDNIVIKPNQIILDRIEYFTYEDILLEYSILCNKELRLAKNKLDYNRINAICDVTFKNLRQLKTPEKIALYEAKLKEVKKGSKVFQHQQLLTPTVDNEDYQTDNTDPYSTMKLSTMVDYTIRVIFYPLKVIMTGDLSL